MIRLLFNKLNPFDTCGRVGCGHYRGVHLPGVGCVWCNCDGFVKRFNGRL